MAIAVWEVITRSATDSTERMLVPGGWIVCRINGNHLPQSQVGWFVSDPKHEWNIE